MNAEKLPMEEVVFKSVLAAQDSASLADTTLALPPEEHITSPTKSPRSDERTSRLLQQVQLTLARRGKKTTSLGSVHSQKNATRYPDPKDGPSPNFKVSGLGFGNQSLSSGLERRPTRRVEVSPLPSPGLPRHHLHYGTLQFGTYTLPSPSQPQRMCGLLDRSFRSDSFRQYAFSEVPHGTRFHTSIHNAGLSSRGATFSCRSGRQTAVPQPLLADTTHNTLTGSIQSPRQMDTQTERTSSVRRATLGSGQHRDGFAWPAKFRRDDLELDRQNSYPASVGSMEVDWAKRREVEAVQIKSVTAPRVANKAPELTIERAVSLLTQDDEDTLITAASFVQNQCFHSEDAKKMVFYLNGIPKLLHLIQSDSEDVQLFAAGALRNLVFQNNDNKMEVKENQGLTTVLHVLETNHNVVTRRQLTGLLWNLSSHDLLKDHLSRDALSILTNKVLVPCSGISEGEKPKDELLADPDTFHNATSCLRNISSAGPDCRKAMRECENLIDSLVYYIRGTIADYKPDDKATENCVCILHNLSYQIEAELPQKYFRDLYESRQSLAPKPKTPGCFGHQSAKITERMERQHPLLEDKANPQGVEWLWSAITVRMYLSLMARSIRHYTQEAAMGALQNITAGNGLMTEAIAHTIVQRENGLQQVRKMLQEEKRDVKRMAVSLLKNLSRHRELHPEIVKQVLPELVWMLPNSDTGTDLPTEVTMSLCHILINLSQNETQNVKAIINQGALAKIINISTKDRGYGPSRAGQAACILLHSMWNHSELHGAYRKAGYKKTDFVNGRTTKAVNASRD
ncbi:plakophilin-2 [Lampris incognitus]|uniref:plakophilin-2 n=1 Tax=Lampris incognitus TaxID=2546036 RepID=UPI0024B4C358|nr:plakophilin-2 [Lampris incognitus]